MQNKYLNKLHELHKITKPNIHKPKYVKYYNNMETKNKINWARIWQIIQAIVTAILAGELATRSL